MIDIHHYGPIPLVPGERGFWWNLMRSLDYLIDSCKSRVAVLTHSVIDPMSTLLVYQSSTEKAQVRTTKRYTKLKTCG